MNINYLTSPLTSYNPHCKLAQPNSLASLQIVSAVPAGELKRAVIAS